MTTTSQRKPFRKILKHSWKIHRWPLGFFALGAWILIAWTTSSVPEPVRAELWKPSHSTVLDAVSFRDGTPSAEMPLQDFQERIGNTTPAFVVMWNGWNDGVVTSTPDSTERDYRLTIKYVALITLDKNLSTYISASARLPDYTFWTYVGKVHVDRENLTFDFYSDGERQALFIPVVGAVFVLIAALIVLLTYLLNRPTTRTPSEPQTA